MEPHGGEPDTGPDAKGATPVNAALVISALRTVAAAGVGLLAAALFLKGPVGQALTSLGLFLDPVWIRVLLLLGVSTVAVASSLCESPRPFLVFAVIAVLLVVPSAYPFSSIDWVGLFAGGSPIDRPSSSQVVVSLELVLLTLCLLAVFYLSWLRGLAQESEEQGVDASELNSLTSLSLRFLGLFSGAAGGLGLAVALLADNAMKPFLDLTSTRPLAVPILGLGASLALAVGLFLGLSQGTEKR